jgi:hypothetical protein
MTRVSELIGVLGRKPIALVVEDLLTKEYLLHAWGAERMHFMIVAAGSHAVVRGVVTDLRKHADPDASKRPRVFGLVDLDFGAPNVSRWKNIAEPLDVLRGEHHEAENYLLDWNALAGCDINQSWHRRTAADIEQWAKTEAAKQVYWLACRQVLRAVHKTIGDDFPPDPVVPSVPTIADAENYVCNHLWMQTLQARSVQVIDRAQIHADLQTAANRFSAALADGSWKKCFSGKEIFRHLLSRIYDVPSTVTATADVDLAISVAKWQADNGQVPAEVAAIRDALKQRVGI